MKHHITAISFSLLGALAVQAQPAVTIYNNDFGVVRDTVKLDLKEGTNEVSYSGATRFLEPQSVVLRDPSGKVDLSIIEQSYRGDPVDQARLLKIFEGKAIRFLVKQGDSERIVSGKILRAPSPQTPEPIIEVDGELRTSLPGTPLFPSLGDGSILQPTLNWKLHSGTKADLDAQLSYLTRGMSWRADYNLVLPEDGDDVVMTGLISLTNNTGKVFEDAKIKLIAGDVNRVPEYQEMAAYGRNMMMARAAVADAAPQVEEKKFDEFHMYTLPLPTTLFDQETKQVEFIRSQDVHSKRVLVYDGSQAGANTLHYRGSSPISAPDYGVESNTSVATYREFKNSEANGLGSALPAGKLRFYRTDSDSQLEFVGENTIKHTPKDETVRVYLGNAFDLVGQRTRTEFAKHPTQNQIRETFSIELRNRGDKQADVQILEHLYRWSNWTITHASDQFKQLDSDTVEFPVSLAPGETRTVNYTVQYTW